MVHPGSAVLSDLQLATLAEHGEERTAAVGEALFEVGDRSFPFIAIIEGEAAIQNAAGQEIIRHGASGFLGELSLLTGQTAFLTAVVTKPMRYIAVGREALRPLLLEDGPLADLVLSNFMHRREALQGLEGVGIEIVGPRSSASTRRLVDFARRSRLPHTWRDLEHEDHDAERMVEAREPAQLPLVRLPGGAELHSPSNGELSRALNIGLTLAAREEVDLVVVGGGPAGLGAAVYAASEGLDTLVVESTALGGQAGTSRRIENYLGFPAGISGAELTSRAVAQARKFQARTATPYRAIGVEPRSERHIVRLEEDHEIAARAVVLATGADYGRPPVADVGAYEGISVFYAAGPPRHSAAAGRASGSSAAGTRPRRRRSGSPVAVRSSPSCIAGKT